LASDLFCCRAGAGVTFAWGFCRLGSKHSRFVICRGFAFLEAYCAHGTRGKAIAQAVAVMLARELCFSAHHFYRTLVAGGCASTATVTFFFVYLYYFSFHFVALLDFTLLL
jgi:hypothetical protein